MAKESKTGEEAEVRLKKTLGLYWSLLHINRLRTDSGGKRMQSQICKHRIVGASQNTANCIEQKSQYSNTM